MTIELKQIHLIEMILATRDLSILDRYEEMLKKTRIEAYEASLKPLSLKEYKNSILEAEKDVKAGRLIDIEDLQKEMENW